ncbi:hypothetical protein HGRIS_011236 [Hohenbuehelia grisea]|uniref:Uncharacterized protein n=1 Tax=Hohenbuehelia grisea TaxID=104357 RepID=A0ABR3JWN6_9AGAR
MVFRIPTHLDSFVPPPSTQMAGAGRPWRGNLLISGMRASDKSSSQEIAITAVETDGDKEISRSDLWSPQFFARIVHEQHLLTQVQAYVRRHSPPLCTFMPDRLRDPNAHTVNQTNFRSLSWILTENQTVAIAGWNSDRIPGAGIIIYPAPNSSAVLVGALFLTTSFPDFIMSPNTGGPISPTMVPAIARHPQYHPHTGAPQGAPYSSGSRHPTSPQRRPGHPGSPVDPSSPGSGQYRYMGMSRTAPTNYPGMPPGSGQPWPAVKSEDDADYTNYPSSSGNVHYPPQ